MKDNIALGNPDLVANDEQIREAARLGGAEEFVDKLPEGFNTYLDRPVKDYYSALPEGTTMLFGRKVEYKGVRGAGAMRETATTTLSGGQMQRLAVYVVRGLLCHILYSHFQSTLGHGCSCVRSFPERSRRLDSCFLTNRVLRSIQPQSMVRCVVFSGSLSVHPAR